MNKSRLLHKYMSAKGMDVIKNFRLLVQHPDNFNDPFEMTSGIGDVDNGKYKKLFSGDYGRKFYEKYKEGFHDKSLEDFRKRVLSSDDIFEQLCFIIPQGSHEEFFKFRTEFFGNVGGVTCFCSDKADISKEILMWSHYADSHKGIRIFFDTSKMKLKGTSLFKIVYIPERLLLDPLELKISGEPIHEIFNKVIESKSDIWEYEAEYRLLVFYKMCTREVNSEGRSIFFFEIDPQAIKGIDLGVAIGEKLKLDIIDAVKRPELRHVLLREASINRKHYALDYSIVK